MLSCFLHNSMNSLTRSGDTSFCIICDGGTLSGNPYNNLKAFNNRSLEFIFCGLLKLLISYGFKFLCKTSTRKEEADKGKIQNKPTK